MTTRKTTTTFWAAEQRDERLRKHYATMPTHQLADMLGCTPAQVGRRAYTLGIKKRPDALSHARSAEQRRARAAQKARDRQAVANPGRMHAYTLPSRVGSRLYYPDGRVEAIAP